MLRKSYVGVLAAGVGVLAGWSTQHAAAQQRFSADKKGSVLVFSKVQIKWAVNPDGSLGDLIEDTILAITNDSDRGGVDVQAYFINGDRTQEEIQDQDTGEILQEFEPGWNTADCRFFLTRTNPIYWSAARGGGNLGQQDGGGNNCQPFTAIDDNGRLSPDGQTRILRGMVIMWAVGFDPSVEKPDSQCDEPEGAFRPIHWNHLAGSALVINYRDGMASEYNAWTGQAHSTICVDETGVVAGGDEKQVCVDQPFEQGDFLPGRLGFLPFDGNVYDSVYEQLLLDFYGTGGTGFSITGVNVSLDTELTLHAALWDVRQDNIGPPLTKADIEIFNEFESKFSGTRRCICCWDSTLIGSYARTVAVPNHFLRSRLGTDKGSARISGEGSTDCNYFDQCGVPPNELRQRIVCQRRPPYNCSADLPLLGIATKLLAFTYNGGAQNKETAAMNLVGLGTWNPDHQAPSGIFHDVEYGSCGLRDGSRTSSTTTNVNTDGKAAAGERLGRTAVGSSK